MPDISMCQDTQCPSREECYRFTAKPSAIQSFQDFSEFRAGQDVCEDFVPNEKCAATTERIAMTNIEPLMTQAEVAELLSRLANISARHVYDRWVHLPDFPKPVLLPVAVGSKRPKRWHRADIVGWAERNKLAA